MNILLIFPKSQCYDNKDDNTQRRYIDVFKKYVKMLDDAGCAITVTLEDKLAFDVLGVLGITPAQVVTCYSPSDIEFLRMYPDVEKLSDRVLVNYSETEKRHYDIEKKYIVDPTLIRKGKVAYLNKRTEIYRERYKEALNKLIAEHTNVMQFTVNSMNDRGDAVRTIVKQGDGRLCIEVDLGIGRCLAYYGGVYVEEDMLPTILSL